MNTFLKVSRADLVDLADALEQGRLSPSINTSSLQTRLPSELVKPVRDELRAMRDMGMTPSHIAHTLRLLGEERKAAQDIADRVELVWSGAGLIQCGDRDTAAIVQKLFEKARKSILVASYALDAPKKAKKIFGSLATRMDADPELDVRLYVNVKREHKDETSSTVLLQRFSESFRKDLWPGERLPEVFYDPRSLEMTGGERACLHAKCVVMDNKRALITSANFTEAAHARNIEAGTYVKDRVIAKALTAQFEALVTKKALVKVPGL